MRSTMLDNIAKFVMFKRPFEEVITSKNMIDIENALETKKSPHFRIYPISHVKLLEDGWEYPEGYDSIKDGRFKRGEYVGSKWGGKYLRAPDIFFIILEKGKDKLIFLGEVAEIKRGFSTGINDFFYLDENMQKKWQIESEFLKPVIKSPKECNTIIIDPKMLKYKVFMCDKSKQELEGTNALKYIQWGEMTEIIIKQGTHEGKKIKGFQNISTVKNRKLWYSLPYDSGSNIFIQMSFNNSFPFYYSPTKILADARLYEIKSNITDLEHSEQLCLSLNSTLSVLFMELFGRSNLGEGALDFKVYEAKKIPIVKGLNIKAKDILYREPKSIFIELGIDPRKPIREQNPKPLSDREAIDNIVFDLLGLSQDEKKEVYWSVCELVKQRFEKANSLKKR